MSFELLPNEESSQVRIICFPFAGGNKYSYNKLFGNIIEFFFINGGVKGLKLEEEELLDLITQEIIRLSINNDYVIYGHSMGALIGYLVCQRIEELRIKKPLKLIISGMDAPSIKREILISHLPNKLFWEEIIKFGGIPDELMNFPELIDFYTPILKADLSAVENYRYTKREKLTVPIDVFYGSKDTTIEKIKGWEEETTEKVTIMQMNGNHFFIFDHIEFFTEYFKNIVKI
nr:thioesterase domain-containing protein [uncultured Flavobacterium sp.]